MGGGGTGQQAYQSHMFGAPSKNTYFQPEPQMYSSRRPVTNAPDLSNVPNNSYWNSWYSNIPRQPSFVHRPFYDSVDPWSAGGAYRTGAFANDPRLARNARVNPFTPDETYYPDGPFLYPMRSGQRRTFRNPPRGVALNPQTPGAYGSWSPGYRPPNPFVPGGYDSYLDPFFGSSGVSDALYGDPYVAPGGGRLGWSPSIQTYLNEYGGSNYTMDTVFNPLFNQRFDISPEGELVSSPGTGGLYNEYESQNLGAFYDMFPQYYDEGRVDEDGNPYDTLGTSLLEDDSSWLVRGEGDAPNFVAEPYEWDMSDPYSWFSRPTGLVNVADRNAGSFKFEHGDLAGPNNPMRYLNPDEMVNLPYENFREYNLGYGLGYTPDGSVFNPIEGAQDYFNPLTGSYETSLFNPGGTALYGGPDSDYAFKDIESWRRLAAEQAGMGMDPVGDATYYANVRLNPDLVNASSLLGDPSGSNFTGQEWGTTDNPFATSMWAQVYGDKRVAPSERVQDEDDPIYDYLKFESDNLSTQDYGGSPSDWQEIGASSRAGDSWVYEIGGLDPEDENYNPKISRLSSAWGQIDTTIPQLGISNFSNFIESHVSKTYDQIYSDGVFPDTYDQNLRMTTSLLHDELHQPGWMGETRTVHPAAGKSIESLTESERADLERIIGSEGDYSNFAYAFSPSTFSDGTWSNSLALLGTGGVGTNLLTGATDQDFFGDVEGLDKVISLSGLSELSEDIGLNEFSSLSRGTRSDPLSSAGGRATSLESAGIEGGNIFGTASSSPSIGRTKDFEDYLSNYMTDARRAPSAPTRYVGDPGFVVGSPYEGETLSPGGDLVGAATINPDTGMFSSNFFLGENNSLDRFGMGETDNPFVQGFGYEENFSDYVSGELLSNLITGTGNTSRDPSSLIFQGDYLDALKAGDPSISAWGAAGGDVQALPDWMSEVPLASEWTPYNPGAPSYLTETESGLPVSQITSIQDLYTDNIDPAPSALTGISTGFYIMQDGGFLSPQPEYASKEPSSDLIDMTVSAVMGEIENPDKVVKEFTAKYGPDALSQLVEDILSGGDGSFLRGPGDGRADDVPGLIDGTEPVFLSSGEYVVPADVVKDLGAGNTDSGAQNLMSMVDEVRAANNGRSAN